MKVNFFNTKLKNFKENFSITRLIFLVTIDITILKIKTLNLKIHSLIKKNIIFN